MHNNIPSYLIIIAIIQFLLFYYGYPHIILFPLSSALLFLSFRLSRKKPNTLFFYFPPTPNPTSPPPPYPHPFVLQFTFFTFLLQTMMIILFFAASLRYTTHNWSRIPIFFLSFQFNSNTLFFLHNSLKQSRCWLEKVHIFVDWLFR